MRVRPGASENSAGRLVIGGHVSDRSGNDLQLPRCADIDAMSKVMWRAEWPCGE